MNITATPPTMAAPSRPTSASVIDLLTSAKTAFSAVSATGGADTGASMLHVGDGSAALISARDGYRALRSGDVGTAAALARHIADDATRLFAYLALNHDAPHVAARDIRDTVGSINTTVQFAIDQLTN